ncbi:hypothetical protein [Pseudoxanthomonas sp.]|uniref:hypothetical protein n=1 Tax=Pseudoxanthomonas sp. TaxID=1871049 RepID=UPI002614FD6C|nr:hypothetical protein [Pseudoxanthomonas sp.]WDS35226.1 MAG: hypothetical protein O8I58_12775 [Pseudoxanthomonas sp.]
MLRSAAQRIVANHPWLPMWSLREDGTLCDALHQPPAPLADAQVQETLQRLQAIAAPGATAMPVVAPDTPAEDPSPLSEALRARLLQAGTVAALSLDGHDVLLLDFRRLLALVPPGATGLDEPPAQLLSRTFEKLALRTLPAPRYSALFVELHSVALIPLLWQAGLRMTTTPLLLAPMEENHRLRLQRWPDFRVLAHRHDDFRLCSLLLRRACTAMEASHALGVDPGAVRAFFNAAWLSGYAQVEAETAVEPTPPPTRHRGPGALLASMWRGVRRTRGG